MPDLEFIKITTYMFDDEKIRIIESMPDADSLLIIWVKLLCQAGKTYAGGYISLNENVAYSEEELASILSRPVNTVRLAINTFKRLNMIEIDDKGIYLKNFPKHQNIEALEKVKENARLRQQKHRLLATGKDNVTPKSRNSHTNITAQMIEEDNRKEIIREETIEEEEDNPPITPPKSSTSESVLNNFLLYKDNIGTISPLIERDIKELEKEYPALWVKDAIKQAVLQNERRMSYIKGILRNWGKEGHPRGT